MVSSNASAAKINVIADAEQRLIIPPPKTVEKCKKQPFEDLPNLTETGHA